MPSQPAAHLVLCHAASTLGILQRSLNEIARRLHRHQLAQRGRRPRVRQTELQLVAADLPAHQQMPVPGLPGLAVPDKDATGQEFGQHLALLAVAQFHPVPGYCRLCGGPDIDTYRRNIRHRAGRRPAPAAPLRHTRRRVCEVDHLVGMHIDQKARALIVQRVEKLGLFPQVTACNSVYRGLAGIEPIVEALRIGQYRVLNNIERWLECCRCAAYAL